MMCFFYSFILLIWCIIDTLIFRCGGGGGFVTKSCPSLATPWTEACQAPLSMLNKPYIPGKIPIHPNIHSLKYVVGLIC